MRIFKYLIVTFFLTLSLNADINKEYYIGIGVYNYDDLNKNRMKKLMLKLANELKTSYGYKINIIFLENKDEILENFKAYEKLNIIITYVAFYLENKESLKKFTKKPFLFNNTNEEKNQFYLIANKESNINSLKDLKGKTFAGYVGDEGYSLWLDYLTRKNLNKPYKELIRSEIDVQKNQRLILNIYFNKADFSVVSKTVYRDMILLNPSIEKRIKVIKKSKPIFFFGLGLFHKNTPKELVQPFYEYIENGEFNKDFEDIFKLLNAYGVQEASFEDLKPLDDYYDEYKELKKE